MDKPTLYLETSVISYLAALPSRDPVTARNQRITREWWDTRRERYQLVTSEAVVDEAAAGDREFARRRLSLLSGMPRVDVRDPALIALAASLSRQVPLPGKAAVDGLHIAASAVYGIEYLLTWDARHIANPVLRPRIAKILKATGWRSPLLCTPAEIMSKGWRDEQS
jgi:hypothetical protein